MYKFGQDWIEATKISRDYLHGWMDARPTLDHDSLNRPWSSEVGNAYEKFVSFYSA